MPALISKLSAAGLGPALAYAFGNDTANNLTATGTNQATAYQTSTAVARFTTVASGTGCMLSQAAQGDSQIIVNAGANTLSVYPPTGHSINGGSANAAFTLSAGSWGYFDRITNSSWLASSDDAANQSFLPSGTGAVTQDIQTVLRRLVFCENYGASSSASAATNSTAIQAALNIGGLVLLWTPGTYSIDTTLSLGSNTRFVLGPGVTIQLAANAKTNLLTTAAYSASTTSVTITWSSGISFSVGWTGHGFSVGDYVWIDNTGISDIEQSKFKGVFRVQSVTDANNFVCHAMRLPSATGTTGFVAKAATVNAWVEGGIWDYNSSNNATVTAQKKFSLIFAGTAGCGVRDIILKDNLKFGLCVASDRAGVYENIAVNTLQASVGDAVKVYGPAYGTTVRNLSGRSGDDFLSIHTREPTAFATSAVSYGDCIGVKAQNITAKCSTGSVCIYASANEYHGGCEIDGVHGSFSSSHPAVRIVAVEPSSLLYDVHVRRVDANCSDAVFIGDGSNAPNTLTAGQIVIEDCTHNPESLINNFLEVSALNNTTINSLVVRSCRSDVDSMTTPDWPTGAAAVFLQLAGTINLVDVSSCEMNGKSSTGARFMQIPNSSNTRQINIRGTRMVGSHGINLQATPGLTPRILLEGNDLTVTQAVQAAASCDVLAYGNSLNSATILVKQTGGTVTLEESGNKLNGTATYASGTVQIRHLSQMQGAAVASANSLTLGNDGNRFQITGTTQINLLDTSNVQGNVIVTLHFQGILTVKHNQAASTTFKPIFLSAGADLTTAAGTQLTLQYDTTDSKWYQI